MKKLLRTNSKEFKNRIHSYLIEVTKDELDGYSGLAYEELKNKSYSWETCKAFLRLRLENEARWNIPRVGRFSACVEWLQGLALNSLPYWESGAEAKLQELFNCTDYQLQGIIYRRSPKMRSAFEALCKQIAMEIVY